MSKIPHSVDSCKSDLSQISVSLDTSQIVQASQVFNSAVSQVIVSSDLLDITDPVKTYPAEVLNSSIPLYTAQVLDSSQLFVISVAVDSVESHASIIANSAKVLNSP